MLTATILFSLIAFLGSLLGLPWLIGRLDSQYFLLSCAGSDKHEAGTDDWAKLLVARIAQFYWDTAFHRGNGHAFSTWTRPPDYAYWALPS